MKKFRWFAPLALVLALGACATQPQFGDQDEAAVKPLITAYHRCLNQQTAGIVNGSDDVTLLTRVVLRNCNAKLQPIGDYLDKRGFDSYFISRYLSNLHNDAGNTVESYILHVKSANASPRAAPDTTPPDSAQ